MYAVYRDRDISAMTLSGVRKVGEVYGIPGAETMTKAALRKAILTHPKNLSPVPHPLIDLPVPLNDND